MSAAWHRLEQRARKGCSVSSPRGSAHVVHGCKPHKPSRAVRGSLGLPSPPHRAWTRWPFCRVGGEGKNSHRSYVLAAVTSSVWFAQPYPLPLDLRPLRVCACVCLCLCELVCDCVFIMFCLLGRFCSLSSCASRTPLLAPLWLRAPLTSVRGYSFPVYCRRVSVSAHGLFSLLLFFVASCASVVAGADRGRAS